MGQNHLFLARSTQSLVASKFSQGHVPRRRPLPGRQGLGAEPGPGEWRPNRHGHLVPTVSPRTAGAAASGEPLAEPSVPVGPHTCPPEGQQGLLDRLLPWGRGRKAGLLGAPTLQDWVVLSWGLRTERGCLMWGEGREWLTESFPLAHLVLLTHLWAFQTQFPHF